MKKSIQITTTLALCIGVLTSLNSCKKASPPSASGSSGNIYFEDGILIGSEGSFGSGNASLSFYSPGTNTVTSNIFSNANNRPLGDVAQSVTRVGNSTYICVNASNKIEVVNSETFAEEATITSVNQPRYMVANGNTGYVSTWDGIVAVLDLTTNSIITTIPVGSGPEKMAISNNNLYVTNSGGYGLDSTISVINMTTNSVIATINIDAYNPTAIVKGSNNTMWVLAKGQAIYDVNWNIIGHDPAKLIEINTQKNTVSSTRTLFAKVHPNSIAISPDGNTLYIGGSWGFPAIYSTGTTNPSTPINLINEINYGFFINSDNGNIFILQEAGAANGRLLRYNAFGQKLGDYSVGIFPSGGTNGLKDNINTITSNSNL